MFRGEEHGSSNKYVEINDIRIYKRSIISEIQTNNIKLTGINNKKL